MYGEAEGLLSLGLSPEPLELLGRSPLLHLEDLLDEDAPTPAGRGGPGLLPTNLFPVFLEENVSLLGRAHRTVLQEGRTETKSLDSLRILLILSFFSSLLTLLL